MNRYITFRDTNDKGDLLYFILQRDFPHYNCCLADQPIVNFVQPMPISSYNLWIVFVGTLRGNFIPYYQSIGDEIRAVMQDMAEWYFTERILKDEKKFKKWKINVSSVTK